MDKYVEIREEQAQEFRDAGFTVVTKHFVVPKKAVSRPGTPRRKNQMLRLVKRDSSAIGELTPLGRETLQHCITLMPEGKKRRDKLLDALCATSNYRDLTRDVVNSRISFLVEKGFIKRETDA